jgi:flavin reductase (DIM6/NTAB) family NADH-FMN oxidoreductase RutF
LSEVASDTREEDNVRDVDYMGVAQKVMAQIRKGAFLTVAVDGEKNTMTIGWAAIGFCWRRSVLMVAVRDSRHTFTLMERAADFTVSVPATNMQDEIMFCGTKSGRDVDKFVALGLRIQAGREVTSPLIDLPGVHFECRTVLKMPMDPQFMARDMENLYPQKDYHTLYFGEIVACYEI